MGGLEWCAEADALVAELTSDKKTDVDYLLFTLQNPKKKPCMVLQDPDTHKGVGGRAAVHDVLAGGGHDDRVLAGAFLATAVDERGSVVSVRRKYIYVLWVGPSVGIMTKGKVNAWSGSFREKFPPCALYLQFMGGTDDLDDLHEDALRANLLAAGGAHKPTRYSFTNRTLIGSVKHAEKQVDAEAERRAREIEERRLRALEERRAREEAKRRAEQEAQRLAREEAERRQREAEQERKRKEEERMAKLREQEEARRKARQAEEQRLAEEERKRKEEERKRKEEEERKRQEAERQRQKILITENATLNGKRLVLLISTMSGSYQQSANTNRLQVMVDGLGLPPQEIERVDGSDANQRERRNELFAISSIRAKYPQVFLVDVKENKTTFVGKCVSCSAWISVVTVPVSNLKPFR